MNNLFICHTQANLILASGLALGRFKEDWNDLILFVDFGISEEMKERLRQTFNRVLFLQSIYPAEFNTFKAKLKWYPEDWAEIKKFITQGYDRAFVVCDWVLLVQKTLKLTYRLNPKVEMAWLEDGITAYYSDSETVGGFETNRFTMAVRTLLVKYLLGVGKYYDREFREMGGLSCLKKVYTCYPRAVREEYVCKELVEIQDHEYMLGLKALYPCRILPITPNSVILVVDKLDRYAQPEKVKNALSSFIEKCRCEGKAVICKFHPRETEIWDIFHGCQTMEKSIGIESVYVSLEKIKDTITIVGIKSAGLMSAKKMGYETISLFRETGETNSNLTNFYSNLEIELL